jgi:hypothetical protein
MRTKVATIQHAAGFERVLEALAQELIESTDEELLEAAKDLGMDTTMRGSAAFIGLKYPAISGMSDFFDVPVVDPRRIGTDTSPMPLPRLRKRFPSRKKGRKPPDRGSESDSE